MLKPEDISINEVPVQQVKLPVTEEAEVELYVKRTDLVHPDISGNKWYKLKYNIIEADKSGYTKVLTFGGAFSNHIYATASAGKIFGFDTIGVIRGEEYAELNPTLKHARECGMHLHYMNREEYRLKTTGEIINRLKNIYGNFYLVPEGGSNVTGVKGSAEILNNSDNNYDYICTSCGSGGTLAGIISALNGRNKALGFAVLKDAGFLKNIVNQLIKDYSGKEFSNWDLITGYHFGGYAKFNDELINFVRWFYSETTIPIEPIYSGKMFFGILDLIKKNFFKKGDRILAIHTGGLQGLKGIEYKIKEKII
jgi:1-aminocyclopropane-1-carboxylate deaminase